MGSSLPSPIVQTIVAPNPGMMTGLGTNTYIVGSGPTFVIDPAVDDDAYLDEVAAMAGDVVAILVTHRHPDHVGGAAALAQRTGARIHAWGNAPAGGASVDALNDGDVVSSADIRLTALHTPGHARDHLCFWLEGAASLFSGDTILGTGTAVIAPPDGNMRAYMETLERLRRLDVARVYPGHGPAL
ncbi:MAG: MBL fold metallo-hydrolase, partial [Actinomycetota bacterium]|nr:MBL fold metallo-hydrolase [Actinomycetota bacterium]